MHNLLHKIPHHLMSKSVHPIVFVHLFCQSLNYCFLISFCHFVVLLNAKSQMLSLSFLIIQKKSYMYGFKQHHLSSISDQSSMLAVLTFSFTIFRFHIFSFIHTTHIHLTTTHTHHDFLSLLFVFYHHTIPI